MLKNLNTSKLMCLYFVTLYSYLFIFAFICLAVPSLSCAHRIFSYSLWDLAPRPGVKPGSPSLGAWSLSHWTTREVPDKKTQ